MTKSVPEDDETEQESIKLENESPEDAVAYEDDAKERILKIERTLASTDALSAMGWTKEEVDNLMSSVSGKDPLSGLGYDGPLAAFSKVRRNLADYFQERVAVVTNPSIDRVREGDHFSLRVFLGRKPSLTAPGSLVQQIELGSPILVGGVVGDRPGVAAAHRRIAQEFATCLIDDLELEFSEGLAEAASDSFSAEASIKRTLRGATPGQGRSAGQDRSPLSLMDCRRDRQDL